MLQGYISQADTARDTHFGGTRRRMWRAAITWTRKECTLARPPNDSGGDRVAAAGQIGTGQLRSARASALEYARLGGGGAGQVAGHAQ
jgi:hypothetical protein